jgi:hypothetical protein
MAKTELVVRLHYHITTLQISNREPATALWAAGRRFGRPGLRGKEHTEPFNLRHRCTGNRTKSFKTVCCKQVWGDTLIPPTGFFWHPSPYWRMIYFEKVSTTWSLKSKCWEFQTGEKTPLSIFRCFGKAPCLAVLCCHGFLNPRLPSAHKPFTPSFLPDYTNDWVYTVGTNCAFDLHVQVRRGVLPHRMWRKWLFFGREDGVADAPVGSIQWPCAVLPHSYALTS